MRAESIDDLQATIFRDVLQFEELPFMATAFSTSDAALSASAATGFVDQYLLDPTTARRARAVGRAQHDIALGTTPGTREDDLKLAVLVQSRALLDGPEINQIQRLAADEVEVTFIGRQQPFWTRTRHRPMRMGASVSPASAGYSGTLGFFGRRLEDDAVVMVSNNHVLANVNGYPLGTRIVQQADGDGGKSPGDEVATLANYVPIQFSGIANAVDAAYAVIDEGVTWEARDIYGNGAPPPVIGQLDPAGNVVPLPRLGVQKTGRTTGHTLGRVLAINVNNYVVNMGSKGTARFDGQLLFEALPGAAGPFSRPGDSGSLIVDMNNVPVALLFAGSQSGGAGNLGTTGANPISLVLSHLGVQYA